MQFITVNLHDSDLDDEKEEADDPVVSAKEIKYFMTEQSETHKVQRDVVG